MAKYGGIDIQGENMKTIFTIDHEDIHFIKNQGWTLIVIPYEPDGSSTDYEYLSIHNDLFGRVLATHNNVDITLKTIDKDTSSLINKYIYNDQ